MDTDRRISIAVVKRLPRYYRYLGELLENDITRISSKELSERMGVTASQIRQDLNNFGGFGQQGYGYNVEYLYNEIGKILGLNNTYKFIIVGVGNLGQALANYTKFEKRGFILKGLFDVNPRLIGMTIRGIEVRDIDEMESFVKENKIDVAFLTLPKSKVRKVAEDLAKWGIKGLWNFSAVDLDLSPDVVVEDVHLSDSLMIMSYNINRKKLKKEAEMKKQNK
ncbi:redox-sensing transcriptional repressor Rex [Defluviitalea raffinosedens]|uniref:Redox-sensing transcriptional repressor Rex n=1 Tax=Defluviitalea raffinosedens TaxID=1450156 RepID=A0A7C8LL87_9FIRM|nr:redox-sensing transcriptional repressor Rex [Defluviitalea raffinosedens]KAE9635407.1 redox-sensing transcriptional repressor Rex [Defluviitalea raffinosedens]MBM7684310.1 redox-sensing transcriptional repressor [Defluviitalea raffinosedens]HHW67586.1 redox-sensing transcriptional repressor Rex [Candidatus Epulonipiscium sp.]